MSALRDRAEDLARRAPPQTLSSERMFVTERAAARLESRRIGMRPAAAPEPEDVETLDARTLRRLLATLWTDPRWSAAATRVIARASAMDRRSLDRALIFAYRRQDSIGHPAPEALRAAAALAAERNGLGHE